MYFPQDEIITLTKPERKLGSHDNAALWGVWDRTAPSEGTLPDVLKFPLVGGVSAEEPRAIPASQAILCCFQASLLIEAYYKTLVAFIFMPTTRNYKFSLVITECSTKTGAPFWEFPKNPGPQKTAHIMLRYVRGI